MENPIQRAKTGLWPCVSPINLVTEIWHALHQQAIPKCVLLMRLRYKTANSINLSTIKTNSLFPLLFSSFAASSPWCCNGTANLTQAQAKQHRKLICSNVNIWNIWFLSSSSAAEILGNGGTTRAEQLLGSLWDWRHQGKELCHKDKDLGEKASVLLKTTAI